MCVHDEFKAKALLQLKQQRILMLQSWFTPNPPAAVIEMADAVGSLTIKATQQLPHQTLIVATDRGNFLQDAAGMP